MKSIKNWIQSKVGSYSSKDDSDTDYVEAVVCKEFEIQNNEMKQLELADAGKILLVKQHDKLSAIGYKCAHYGAPLNTGTLGDNRIRCPWHGACFNASTGDVEDFPGLDSLPCYNVSVKDGEVLVRAKRRDLETNKRIKDMVKRDPDNETTFVIIGGGPSGGVCIETLRQEDFTGRIVLICKESNPPYDRIKLTKAMDLEIEKLQFRTPQFYEEYGIETMLGVAATKVDASEKTVMCSNGYSIKFDKLYVASGATPFRPKIPGVDLKNVFTLRDHADGTKILEVIGDESQVVCLGLSFISLESAAYLVKKVKKVTVVGRDNVPLLASFGPQIGQRVLELFKENGVEMVMNSGIKNIIGTDGVVKSVELADGTQIPCDALILGTGATFNTTFLKDSGVKLNDNGSVDVDMHLRTNIPCIYAGGDLANAPVFSLSNVRTTIGHYQLAQYHGRIAAKNMADKMQELKAVPFFWTVLFGKSIRYSGHGRPNEIHIEGDLKELKFVAFYYDQDGNVIAMASCQRDPVVAQFAELQSQGRRLHRKDIEASPFGWAEQLKV
ncbi:unnamed protein product [Hermetia illucens]|uniref:Rieske domain-containing protein n=1 Tax=Hermetia illucens TaxID=343691 RepID=A0A7R8YYB6_HERIL|nr:apoptosis-inducing factor 3 isoform X3 [Hermetia illucens]CAD7086655.1 unnamed protein product [Hermetia illucens]